MTLILEENWWQLFLHIVIRCLENHKNGKFMDIVKCIIWDFDYNSGYFLLLLVILCWFSDISMCFVLSDDI